MEVADPDPEISEESEQSNANLKKIISRPQPQPTDASRSDLALEEILLISDTLSKPSDEELLPDQEVPAPAPFTLENEPICKSCEEVSSSHEEISGTIVTELGPSPSCLKSTPTLTAVPSRSRSRSITSPLKQQLSMPSTATPTISAVGKYLELEVEKPSFKIRYASDYTLSFSLFSPITPVCLKNILVQHTSLKFACFHAGVNTDKTRFVCHDRISLPSLKKITFLIPPETGPLPQDFKRLCHFLSQISYGRLESLRMDCDSLTAAQIPLASAFLPSYEPEDAHPLSDLILKNRETLQRIVIGRILKEMTIKMYPTPCDTCPGTCEPRNYPRIENFTCFPNLPLLPSLSCLLQKQKHLHKLVVTLSHDDVWRDVIAAIKLSRNNLRSFSFSLVPIDGDSVTLDLKVLRDCKHLKELSMQFRGCNVVGWGFVPDTIKTLHLLGGSLTHSDTELMSLALPNIEEVNVFLAPDEEVEDDKRIEAKYKHGPVIMDVVHHPAFHFVKAAPKTLKTFNCECDTGVEVNWEELRSTLAYQKEFKLIERTQIGDFSLERQPLVEKEEEIEEGTGDSVKETSDHSFLSTCLGVLGLKG